MDLRVAMGAVCIGACALVGCRVATSGLDAAEAPHDASIVLPPEDAPPVGDDVRLFGEPPRLDCDDPAFWSAVPARRNYIWAFAPTTCFFEIPTPTFTTRLVGSGYADFCVRVHASDRPELPVGVTRWSPSGVLLGLAAPATVDLEIREWAYTEDEGWVLSSERGAAWLDPPPPLVLVRPRLGEIGADITHVLGPDGAIQVSTTDIVDTRTGARRAHGPLLAVGLIGDSVAWVRDESPPMVEILGADLSSALEQVWDAPFDPAHVTVLPFGVISGDLLLRLNGASPELVALPTRLDEVAPSGRGASGRAGDQAWIFGADGTWWMGPTGVGEIAGTGELLSTDRRLFAASGPEGEPIDPAIGHVLTVVRRFDHLLVIGEHGVAQLARDLPLLGGGTFVFDPVTVGVGAAWVDPFIYSRRADGVMVVQSYPDLEPRCE